jgi:hypothetical protein
MLKLLKKGSHFHHQQIPIKRKKVQKTKKITINVQLYLARGPFFSDGRKISKSISLSP